ncbi:MAG: glycosyltransferase [Sphingobacteriales bacterium]|nr:MAG: glycosyltransferase [Sphingobacteriales bacterium]
MARIVIIGTAHPLRGGLAAFNQRLAEALQQEGHQVRIESFSLQYPGILFPGKSQYTDEPAPEGLSIRSRINSIHPLSWIRVGRALQQEKPDLIIIKFWLPFMGPAFGTILRLAKKNRHTRVVAILDNFIPHEARPGDAAFTRYFSGPVDAFVTMSRQVLGEVEKALPQKPATYTPHPIYDLYGEAVSKEDACRKLGLDVTRNYLLFFGFIRAYKGLDLLLQALPQVTDGTIDLIIAGEYYGDPAPYEQLIVANGLEGRVHRFTDFIPTDEVRYFFSAADLVVQPYKSATNSGITQVAYHFEKPMVVTNVGGLPEVVPDGKAGFVVAPDPAAIADGINRFFEGHYSTVFQAGLREEKAKYSWKTFVDVILQLAGRPTT